jgi:hypothetical protein
MSRDGIWLLPRPSAQPVRIATPLFRPGNWPAYYGQVDWLPSSRGGQVSAGRPAGQIAPRQPPPAFPGQPGPDPDGAR